MFAGRILCYAVRMSRLNLATLPWPAEALGEGGNDFLARRSLGGGGNAATAMALKSYSHRAADRTRLRSNQPMNFKNYEN